MDKTPPVLAYAPAERFSPWPNVAYAALAGLFAGLLSIGSFVVPVFAFFLPGLAFGIIVGSRITRGRSNTLRLVFQFALISMVLHAAMALLLLATARSGIVAQLGVIAGVSAVQVWLGASIAGARALLHSVLMGAFAGSLCALPWLMDLDAINGSNAFRYSVMYMSTIAWHTATAATIGFSQTPGENAFTQNPPFG